MKNSKLKSVIKHLLMALLLFAICLSYIHMPVYAASDVTKRTVRVAFPLQAGLNEKNAQGDLTGYNYDYMKMLAEYAGWNIEYITIDDLSEDEAIVKAMEMIQNGEADLLGATLKNAYTEPMFEFPTENCGAVYTTLLTLESSAVTESNYFTVSPLRVAIYKDATNRNNEVTTYLKSIGATFELVECDTEEEQYQAVKEGQADVFSNVSLNRFPNTRTVASFAQRPYYFVTKKGNTSLSAELNEAIKAIDYSRPYFQTELQYKYFGPPAVEYELTDSEKQMFQKTGSLNVLCVAQNAPYVFKEKDGSATGMLVSVLDDFAKQSGLTLQYSFCDSSDDISELFASGSYDCIIGIPFSSEFCVANGTVCSYPVANAGLVTVRKDSMTKTPSESTLGIVRNLADAVPLSEFKDVVLFDSTDDCLNAVRKGKIDMCCGNRSVVEYYNYEASQSLITTSMVGYSQDVCIAFSKKLGLEFLTCANNYIRAISDITKNAYLSEANYHLNHNVISHFIHTQPVQATIVFMVAITLLLSSVFLGIAAYRRKKTNDALANANAAKTQFLSRVSHDMRTPLNGILGMATLMKDKSDIDELHSDLESILLSGQYLSRLVNDTLDMNRIEEGRLSIKKKPVKCKDVFKNVVLQSQILAEERHINFVVDSGNNDEKEWTVIMSDEERLEQILMNIISNAIKYTQEGGTVEFRRIVLKNDGKALRIRFVITDNGIGMSEKFLPHLFEPFHQEGRMNATRQNGTGLGMAIVKQIVELMDGTIQVHSELNEGTQIAVEIPFELCTENETDNKIQDYNFEILRDKRVLLCEDHPLNQKIAVTLLEKVGVSVTTQENGLDGLKDFVQKEAGFYSAILMDIRMPIMDGIDATRRIRQCGKSDAKSIPIIAMTANAFEDDAKECKAAGMNEHISKPVDPQVLYTTLAKMIIGAL